MVWAVATGLPWWAKVISWLALHGCSVTVVGEAL